MNKNILHSTHISLISRVKAPFLQCSSVGSVHHLYDNTCRQVRELLAATLGTARDMDSHPNRIWCFKTNQIGHQTLIPFAPDLKTPKTKALPTPLDVTLSCYCLWL